ncbi:hypothetical protein MtrunA17_Chr2g0322701 [Medicago truncatula]|uniref:Uncharacterized protein n=1 Tax=Medicago truncatula TaxID=3880 RepID=A0A396JFU7_MEDTR|nr:hypothetical protein MtrunA17_Chr2g0322701 [Medicago truncatula]
MQLCKISCRVSLLAHLQVLKFRFFHNHHLHKWQLLASIYKNQQCLQLHTSENSRCAWFGQNTEIAEKIG